MSLDFSYFRIIVLFFTYYFHWSNYMFFIIIKT